MFIRYHCTSGDVNAAIARAFDERGIIEIAAVRLRSDNNTQFVCSKVERPFDLKHVVQELVHLQTPKEDAHVDLFNSILEREAIRRLAFSSFETQDRHLRDSSTYATHTDCILQSVT